MFDNLKITEGGEGLTVGIRVVPNAERNAVAGEYDGNLKVKIKAKPVDNRANDELIKYMAGILEKRKYEITIKSGERGRNKSILVAGMNRKYFMEKIKKELEQ